MLRETCHNAILETESGWGCTRSTHRCGAPYLVSQKTQSDMCTYLHDFAAATVYDLDYNTITIYVINSWIIVISATLSKVDIKSNMSSAHTRAARKQGRLNSDMSSAHPALEKVNTKLPTCIIIVSDDGYTHEPRQGHQQGQPSLRKDPFQTHCLHKEMALLPTTVVESPCSPPPSCAADRRQPLTVTSTSYSG